MSTSPKNSKTANIIPLIRKFLGATIRDPYAKLDKPAKSVKALAQMLIGVLLAISIGIQVAEVLRTSSTFADIWGKFEAYDLLEIIADALLVATAIELGYLLFTDGPDEAINTPIIALAAAILFRIPDALTSEEDGWKRAVEVGIFSLSLAILVWTRARFLDSEAKRKAMETQNAQAKQEMASQ